VSPQQDYVKTALRVPPDLHRALHASAKDSVRSLNGEIIALLHFALEQKQKRANQGAQQ